MRTPALGTVHAHLIIACSLLALASPLSKAQAQEEEGEEESGDLDEMMQTDPDRPAAEEGAPEGEGDEDKSDGERPPGEGGDEERPPGDPEDQSADEGEADVAPAPVDEPGKGFRIGGLFGYGISLEDGPNVWGVGLGLQAGYDTGLVVIGARWVYYLGGTAEETVFNNFGEPSSVDVTANLWELGVELGIDLALSPMVAIRPEVGLGFANLIIGDFSKLYGAVSPGVALVADISSAFYVGFDVRFQVVTSTPEVSKGIVLLGAFGGRV